MSRPTLERLADIEAACAAINEYIARADIDEGIVFDAIRIRLIEIGEAVKDIDPAVLASEPEIPWTDIARMRDQIAHRYFDTAHDIVKLTAREDIPRLLEGVRRIQDRLG